MSKKQILSDDEIKKTVEQLASDVIGNYSDFSDVILVGILTNGVPLAERISQLIKEKTGNKVPVGKLDVSLYRDDLITKGHFITVKSSDIPMELTDKTVILVDDVLFHGRTIRAALDGILDYGRPKKIELLVLIDRGHREIPIRADYIGKEIETKKTDHIRVNLYEVNAEETVILEK